MGLFTSDTRGSTALKLLAAAMPLAALAWMAWPIYPFIEDDALISLRYAQRLLNGHGLTWTDGKPVEGYSNLLWVLLSATLGALGMDLILAVRIMACASVAASVWALYRLQSKRDAGDFWPAWLPAIWLCMSAPAAIWSIAGLETPLVLSLLLFVALDVAAVCGPPGYVVRREPAGEKAARERRRQPYGSAIALALLVWTRPDSPIFVVPTSIVLLLMAPGTSRDRVRAALVVALIPALAWAMQTSFRWQYYGELLPNTALIKVTWPPKRIDGGIEYVKAAYKYLWPALLGGSLGALVGLACTSTRAVTTLMLAWGAVWIGYVIFIGGDHFPGHRHMLLVVGLCAALMAQGLRLLFAAQRELAWCAAIALLLGILPFRQLQQRDPNYDIGKLARWQWDGEAIGQMIARAAGTRRPLWAVTAAGAIPFFSQLPAIDMLGLNDAHIARQPAQRRYRLAHDHGDGRYVLDRKPDLITFGLPTGGPPGFVSGEQMKKDPRLQKHYRPITFRALRPHVVESKTYVRLDGVMGISREADRISYPAYLLRGGVVAAPAESEELAAWLPAHQRVVSEPLEMQAGVWSLRLIPENRLLTVDVMTQGDLLASTKEASPRLIVTKPTRVQLGFRSDVETQLTAVELQRHDIDAHGSSESSAMVNTFIIRRGARVNLSHATVNMVLSFDTLPHTWAREGDAMAVTEGTLPRQQQVSGQHGGLLNTYHSKDLDRRVGRLRSPKVTVSPRSVLRMRVGGGQASDVNRQVGVGLYVNGRLVHIISGENTEHLAGHVLDLSPYAGRDLEIEIFDQARDYFGHILVDELSLHSDAWPAPQTQSEALSAASPSP